MQDRKKDTDVYNGLLDSEGEGEGGTIWENGNSNSSNSCFLICIQISQEAGQVVWYSLLFKDFPQFAVIHTVKHFGMVNKAEVDVFSGILLLFQ